MSKDYFNAKADTWDEEATEKDTSKLQVMISRLYIKPGATLLDLGTGTGVLMPFLVQAVGPNGQVIGLDYAKLMLKKAIAKSIRLSIIDQLSFLLADVGYLPLMSGRFDTVVSYSSFPHFHRKPQVLAEIYRVLKIQGRIFICHTSGRELINHIHAEIPLFVHDLLPEKAEMEGLLVSAGFQKIRIEDNAESYLAVAEKL